MIVFSSARVLRQIAVKSMSNYAYTPRSATPSNLDKSHCNRQNRVFTGLYTMIYKTVKPVNRLPEELTNEKFNCAKR
jgi:hypothetical protein